jgi:histidinol-phosphate aminotransferase
MNPMFDPTRFVRPSIQSMTPYVPIKPFEVLSEELGLSVDRLIKLDANENPYGASPKALEALSHLAQQTPIYPDPASQHLRAALAQKLGVAMEQIVLGAGADELIELLFKLFTETGQAVVNCPPTFGMYSFFCGMLGLHEVTVHRCEDYRLDIEAIEQAVRDHAARLLFIASPNNPDGSALSRADLRRLLALETIVVLDEAYIAFQDEGLAGEFGEDNTARWVAQYPNLIVLRTFSKWAGLAGLRCGYGVFDPAIARYMLTIKQPYNINVAVDAAARASLQDLALLTERVEILRAGRALLYEKLARFSSLRPIPHSQANFILVEVLGRPALEVKQALAQRGVLVRYFAKPRLENHIRISIGTPQQMERLLQALDEVLCEAPQ